MDYRKIYYFLIIVCFVNDNQAVSFTKEQLKDGTAIIAHDKNEKVGVIGYSCELCFIGLLAVAQSHRNRGIAKELVTIALNDMKQKDCQNVEVEAAWPIRGFFAKLGFKNQMPWYLQWYPIDMVPMKYTFPKKNI